MTLEEFQKQLNRGRVSEQFRSLQTLREAVNACSEPVRERLRPWAETLEKLSQLNKRQPEPGEFDSLREAVFQGLGDLISNYQAPGELFAYEDTRKAMNSLFTALDLQEGRFSVPDFSKSDRDEAVNARKEDLLDYAAQVMAFRNLGQAALPEEMFQAMEQIPLWKKDRAIKNLMEEGRNTEELLSAGNSGGFIQAYREERKKIQSETRTFKQYSDMIAQKYRSGDLTYAQLETQMQALRELTAGAVSGEKDPVKRSRLQQQATVYMPDFLEKVGQLEHAREQERLTIASNDYQQQLAEGNKRVADEMLQLVYDVYGSKPTYHPGFAPASNQDYTPEIFREYLPEVDLSGYQVGDDPVTDAEFAGLATLAMYNPFISNHVSDDKSLIAVGANEDVSNYYHSHRVINFANGSKSEGGRNVLGPDFRAAKYIPTEICVAKERVKMALQYYKDGDVEPLAQILARGIRCGTDLTNHEVHDRKDGMPITAGKDSPARLAPIDGHMVLEELLCSAQSLMDRDPKLAEAVRGVKEFGVTEADENKIRGFRQGHQIIRAGDAAMEKLLEAARGGDQLSEFEKVECALAVQRRNTLLQSLQDSQKAAAKDPGKMTIENRDKEKRKEIETRFAGRMKSSEAIVELRLADATREMDLVKLAKTPPIYERLGRGGTVELDCMALEKRLPETGKLDFGGKLHALDEERERLGKMSAFQLAAEMGITAPQTVKTTAQDLYDDLTRDYKAGKMNYTLYEARLRTMRELTGGNKQVKISLSAIDDAIDYKLKKEEEKRAPIEKAISDMIGRKREYEGSLGFRLRGIYDVYGLKPKILDASITNNGYDKASFAKLKDFTPAPEEKHLTVQKFTAPLDNDDFGAISIAVTQAYPELGGTCFVKDEKTGETVKGFENPTYEDAQCVRTAYTTDACQGAQGARVGYKGYLLNVTIPAREKADAVLRAFNGGSGDAKELGKILGLGLKAMITNYVAVGASQEMLGDNLLEGAVAGRLLDIIERSPKLKQEALNYCNQDDLDNAQGLRTAYDITRAAREAKEKMKQAAEKNERLPEEERTACIELLLRHQAMLLSAKAHARVKEQSAEMQQAEDWFENADREGNVKATIATQRFFGMKTRIIGLPDYVKMLGKNGPDYARDLLDKALPGREAFFRKSDNEILAGLKNIGSKDDPFQNKEYTRAYQEEKVLKAALREARMKAPEADKKTGVKSL